MGSHWVFTTTKSTSLPERLLEWDNSSIPDSLTVSTYFFPKIQEVGSQWNSKMVRETLFQTCHKKVMRLFFMGWCILWDADDSAFTDSRGFLYLILSLEI
jgi:hypothetical protein